MNTTHNDMMWGHLLARASDPSNYLATVQQNGYALEFVKQQTPKLCLAAVQQN
jgi:hypothetical protein